MTLQPTMLRPASRRPTWQVVVGLLLALPAFILLIISYVEPTIWTIRSSFQKFSGQQLLAGHSGGESVGFDNYTKAFDNGLGSSLGHVLGLAVLPLLVVVVLAPALAWAAGGSGRTVRWITRGALTIPLAAFAPLGIAMAHAMARHSQSASFYLGTFGVTVAAAALLYLAAFRTGRSPWPGVVLGGLLAILAVIALTLQEFVYSQVFSNRTPDEHTTSPVWQMMRLGLVTFNFGIASAVSTMVLIPLMVLGLAATGLIIVTGLRLQVAPEPATRPAPRWTIAPWAVLLVLVLVIAGFGLGPWLSHIGDDAERLPSTWVNTWVPPLISTLVGVSAAAIAAFGISGLRPLGRFSELLLLPFGLYLFVGVGPLALRSYAAGATANRLNSFAGLIPPSWLVVPALFVLALLFRGQATRRRTLEQENRPAPWAGVILPALPMLALAYLVTWVVQAQDTIWPWVSSSQQHPTGQFAIYSSIAQYSASTVPYARLLPLPMLILFIVLGVAAQLAYLDRVALHYGLPERDHPPRT